MFCLESCSAKKGKFSRPHEDVGPGSTGTFCAHSPVSPLLLQCIYTLRCLRVQKLWQAHSPPPDVLEGGAVEIRQPVLDEDLPVAEKPVDHPGVVARRCQRRQQPDEGADQQSHEVQSGQEGELRLVHFGLSK